MKTSKQVKKDTQLITLVGVDTQLVPAPNHLPHWALPSDESEDEGAPLRTAFHCRFIPNSRFFAVHLDSDHDNDWRLDLAERGSQESDDDLPEDLSAEDSDEAPAADAKNSTNKKRKREEEAPAAAAAPAATKPAAAAKSTQAPDAKKPKKAVQSK